MFDTIRDHKKYLMGFLLILIIPSFVLVGVQGFKDRDRGGAVVAVVNGQDISQRDWDQAHQTESRRLQERMPNLDTKLLDTPEARYSTLEQLVQQRVLAVATEKARLYTSDQRLARELQQNQVIASLRRPDGSLDMEAYRQLLGRQGMSPEMFEAKVRTDLSQRQLLQGIEASGFATPSLAAPSLNAFFEQREIRFSLFAAPAFAAQVQLSPQDLEAFYTRNAALFQSPEQADVEYIVLDAPSLEHSVNLPEADVRAYYEQNAARLSGAEERRASHILLTVAANASAAEKAATREKAAALLAQVKAAPQTFAQVAKTQSQDPGSAAKGGDLDFFARGAMVKPFEDAVFSLQKGGISELVETEFGFHIIQLTDIKTPPQRSFEAMRPEIEATLKKQQAQKLFAESAEAFSNLVYEQSDSFSAAAERFKLKPQIRKGLTRKPAADAGVLGNERLLNALFTPESVEKKRNTEAVETASGQLVSARIVQHTPARTQPLTEVTDTVRQRLTAERAAELARRQGSEQLQAWKGGAEATGLSPAQVVSRDKPGSLNPKVLKAALSADPKALPAWVGVDLGDQGYAVVKVDKVMPPQAREASTQAQEVQQYGQWWAAAESQAYNEVLKERLKVRIKVPAPAAAPKQP
ncbi:MAG: hypothetical protein RLZZ352_2037 [Pseudomonadota bacterium]|jgi:peptidyl-prolyl cis-trans isomerase D